MNIKYIKTFGFKLAMTGMRYPKNSEKLSDSTDVSIGKNDLELLLKLTKAGKDHRKALRMIHVQASIDMPISWWIQYDTYKVGTTANSRSRMHKMGSRLLTKDDFYVSEWTHSMGYVLDTINGLINDYQKTKSQATWKNIIDLLPMSYQQERIVDINYEVLIAIFNSRYIEKLQTEWRYFCDSFLKYCPKLKKLWDMQK